MGMTESQAGPGPADDDRADPPAPASGDGDGPDWGRLIDAAGIIAAVLLVAIVADIWTDGKLITRRLNRAPGGGEPGDNASG